MDAWLSKRIAAPSGEKTGAPRKPDGPLPSAPVAEVETRVMAPVVRSLTKMSWLWLWSFATRFAAELTNDNFVPSGEKAGP